MSETCVALAVAWRNIRQVVGALPPWSHAWLCPM